MDVVVFVAGLICIFMALVLAVVVAAVRHDAAKKQKEYEEAVKELESLEKAWRRISERFCPKCGSPLEKEHRFCPKCGNTMESHR